MGNGYSGEIQIARIQDSKGLRYTGFKIAGD